MIKASRWGPSVVVTEDADISHALVKRKCQSCLCNFRNGCLTSTPVRGALIKDMCRRIWPPNLLDPSVPPALSASRQKSSNVLFQMVSPKKERVETSWLTALGPARSATPTSGGTSASAWRSRRPRHRRMLQFRRRCDECGASCSYSSFLLLVVMPGAPSSVLAPSSKARSP